MIIVTTTTGQRREFPTAARFLTEEMFNNACLHDNRDQLLAVFAAGEWTSIEVDNGSDTTQT